MLYALSQVDNNHCLNSAELISFNSRNCSDPALWNDTIASERIEHRDKGKGKIH